MNSWPAMEKMVKRWVRGRSVPAMPGDAVGMGRLNGYAKE
jgi:hypothetical protein